MAEGGSVTCRFIIGTTAGKPAQEKSCLQMVLGWLSWLWRRATGWICTWIRIRNMRKLSLDFFPNQFTAVGVGAYKRELEACLEVIVTEIVPPGSAADCVEFCRNANHFVGKALSKFRQESIFVEIELLSNDSDRSPMKWPLLVE